MKSSISLSNFNRCIAFHFHPSVGLSNHLSFSLSLAIYRYIVFLFRQKPPTTLNNDTEPIFFFFLYFKGQISSQLFSAMFFSKIFLFKEKREECTQKQQQQKTSTILSPALSIRFRVFRYIYFSTKKKKKLRNEKRKKKTQKEENKIAFHLFLSNTIRFVYNFVSV